MTLLIEAPDCQSLEGTCSQHIDFDSPFSVTCVDTGELIKVLNPWDCDITILED